MKSRRLSNEQILAVCKNFIAGRGFACKLNVSEDIKNYLLKYKYIYINEGLPDYYFLDKRFYKNYKKEIEKMGLNRFEKELIKNYFALNIIYFDEEIMHLFLNNPKFHFHWSGYRGYVYSTENSKLDVYIKNLCLCHDLEENKIVIGMLMVDLIDLSEQSQLILQPFMIEDDGRRYEMHSYNIKNLFWGEFLDIDEESIYDVLLEGIRIVNYIFESKYNFKLFNNEYDVSELQFYMPLFYPTKVNRFNFMMELAKIFLDNINGKDLKKKIREEYETMKNNNEFTLEDLKKEGFRGLRLFKTYFGQYDLFNMMSYEKLDQIRKLRTEPAHKIYQNDLDYSYAIEQDGLLKDLYRVLNNIIKVEDPNHEFLIKYKDGIYNCFYGENGSIFEANGFNNKKYHYYDGYLRLINDKFNIRDAEVLIAGNSIDSIKKTLIKKLHNNCNISVINCKRIVEIIFNEEICIPNEKELESFFYGQAYINKFFGERGNYKIKGKKKYEGFKKNDYKYCYLFADSTDLYWDYDKTIKIVGNDPLALFGCGLLMTGLSNNFATDNSNIFLDDSCDFYIKNNTWD